MVRVSRVLWLNIALHDSAQQRFAALHLQHAAQNLRAERPVDHLLMQHTAVADDQTAVFADIVDFVRDRGKQPPQIGILSAARRRKTSNSAGSNRVCPPCSSVPSISLAIK